MNRLPRIVIVGASGRLGQALHERMSRQATVIGLTRPRIDLASPRSISEALLPLDFDSLILPAAMTAVDPCETDQETAYAINATAPRLIAEICSSKKVHMTHVSTDFVFDGVKAGPYTEDDEARPMSVYGASKLKGEQEVLAVDSKHLVVRVSWLYGPGKPAFPEWIIEKARTEAKLMLPADKTGCPTSSTDVAELIVPLLERAASGVFHLCNSGACTWQQWGQACIELAKEAGMPLQCGEIKGNSLNDIAAFLAKRPPNSAMSTAKYTAFTGVTPRPWHEALRRHLTAGDLFRKYESASCG